MGKIILVRHGETELNRKKVYFGRLDPSLNETGRAQILKGKERVKKLHYDHVYASPLLRAYESAKLICEPEEDIILDERLMELNFGIFEGLSYEEIKERYPEQCEKHEKEWKNYNYECGESPRQLQRRAVKFIKSLDKNKDYLIVTHWGVIATILSYYFSKGLDSYWKFDIKNGGVAVIEFMGEHPILKEFNVGG
jgi:alpha-ribazole phosphatase